MYTLPLEEHPNFKYRAVLEGYEFRFHYKYAPVQDMWFIDYACDELDIDVAGMAVVTGNNLLKGRGLYQMGVLALLDLQGSEDPEFTGFGDRWKMVYITKAEVDAGWS